MSEKKPPLRDRRRLVRTFRKQTGLTLVDLGKLAELSNPMLSQFENGKVNLSDESWKRLCDAMEKFLLTANENYKAEIAKAKETAAKLSPEACERIRQRANEILARPSDASNDERITEKVRGMFFELRQRSGLTLAEAAQKSGIDDAKLALYENGRAELTEEEESRLRRALTEGVPRMSLSELLGAKPAELIGQRKEFVARLENLHDIDDPVIAEIIASFRREIEDLEETLNVQHRVIQRLKEDAD